MVEICNLNEVHGRSIILNGFHIIVYSWRLLLLLQYSTQFYATGLYYWVPPRIATEESRKHRPRAQSLLLCDIMMIMRSAGKSIQWTRARMCSRNEIPKGKGLSQ